MNDTETPTYVRDYEDAELQEHDCSYPRTGRLTRVHWVQLPGFIRSARIKHQ